MHREIKIFTDAFFRFFQPVIAAAATASNAKALMLNLGYLPPEQFRVFDNLRARVNSVRDVIEAMAELSEEDIEADPQLLLDTIRNGVESISGLISDIQNLPSIVQSELNGSDLLAQTDILERLPLKLYDYLTIRYLKEHHNRVYSALKLFGIIEIKEIREASNPFYFPRLERTFHWDKLAELLTSPMQLLKASLKDNSGYFYEKTMLVIQEVGLSLGLMPHYKFPDPDVLKFINNDPLIDTWPGFQNLEILRFPLIPRKVNSLGLDIYPLINTTDNRIKGLVLVLRVDPGEKVFVINDKLKLGIELSGVANGLGIVLDENDEFRFVADLFASPQNLPDNVQFDFRARLTRNDEADGDNTEKLFQLGTANGNRFEVGSYNVTFGIGKQQNARLYLETELLDCFIRMKFDGADGFISKVIGDGIESDFSFGIGFSNDQGFYFAGSSGLEIELPTHITLGPLQIRSLSIGITSTEEKIAVTFASSVQVNMGPVTLLVRDIGVSFPGKSDTAVFVPNVTFKPPTGVGLVIDASVVVGGGYLFFDAQKEEYGGILQLEIAETIAVKAIGLLTTRMPDGSKGFSLVVIIAAQGFPPIQLGFGFTLIGIGGLLGVNRTVMVDVLRSGLKNGTLGSILFPDDPIRNAPQIVSDLRAVFPPVKDRYVFGPMAIIAWGTPAILTLEIGLILELPEPVRLIILGRLRAVLPDEDHALVHVRMDAIGVIDFNKGEVSLDATLYDSRILAFVLTGDMALRANWGAQPNFILAIGGFNPRFPAPAGFPQLARLALSLGDSDNPRLRFESYLALTSNTVQFGARLDFSYSAAGFTLAGFLGFDALFQFAPFQFIADVGAMVALKRGGSVLMGVALEMTLAGPTPWHVCGKASFKVLFFNVSIRFDHRFGREEPPSLPEPIDVLALLVASLSDRRNWSSVLPRGEHPIVSLRDSVTTPAVLRVHPLAELAVRQRVVPLNRAVTKFGNAPLAEGATSFTLAASRIDNRPLPMPSTMVRDAFALAQYQEMSDEEKLARPAFETQDAGLQFGVEEAAYQYEALTDTAISYETLIIDPTRPPEKVTEPYVLPQPVLDAVVGLGAAGQALIRRSGSSRYRALELAA